MKIIIGLGNPETQYVGTRHNIGFEIASKLKEAWDFPDFEFNKKFNAEISKGSFEGKEFLLVRPQTFVNLSGEAVQKILEFYKLTPDDIVVVHDDLDIALGKFKIATDSSSAGHNGVQNIIDRLGTQKFKRIRIGIKLRTEETLLPEDAHLPVRSPAEAGDYVLDKFSEKEREKIKSAESAILEEIKKLL